MPSKQYNNSKSNKTSLMAHPVSHNETLFIALFVALLMHAFIIFGVSFTVAPNKQQQANQTLDIVLVKTEADKAPEEADYLAQADQLGGGTQKEKDKPTSKAPGESPQQGNALEDKMEVAPATIEPVIEKKSTLSAQKPSQQKAPELKKKVKPKPEKKPDFSADYVSRLQQQIVEMEAELDEKSRAYAKRPKATYITASTKRAPEALYLKQWTKKIERIGNLNYPDKARRDKLQGQLVLAVSMSPDGNIISVEVRKSSGHKILDDAAKRIVELAAPYAAVPENVLRGNRRLVITRTWQFTHTASGKLSAK
jgi:protein TonB